MPVFYTGNYWREPLYHAGTAAHFLCISSVLGTGYILPGNDRLAAHPYILLLLSQGYYHLPSQTGKPPAGQSARHPEVRYGNAASPGTARASLHSMKAPAHSVYFRSGKHKAPNSNRSHFQF